MPAASTPGSALTRARICWKISPRFSPAASVGGAVVVVHFDRGGAIGLKAEVHVKHFEKAAQQQARTDQQHAGQRNFRDDQRGADALMFAAQARAGTGILEHLLQIAASHPEPRKQAEHHGGEDCDENGPAQRLAIDAQSAEQRQRHRSLVREPRDQRFGQPEPQGRARAGEQPGSP